MQDERGQPGTDAVVVVQSTRLDYAISRLTAWLRDYGDQKNPAFVDDVQLVLNAAIERRRSVPITRLHANPH